MDNWKMAQARDWTAGDTFTIPLEGRLDEMVVIRTRYAGEPSIKKDCRPYVRGG
jgi:hypothetical protein